MRADKAHDSNGRPARQEIADIDPHRAQITTRHQSPGRGLNDVQPSGAAAV